MFSISPIKKAFSSSSTIFDNSIIVGVSKRSFESGECDLYHVIEEPYGQYKKNSYTLVKVKDNTEEGKAHKEQYRKLTSLRLSREK